MNDPTGDLRELRLAMLWKASPRLLRRILEHLESGRLPFPWTPADLERLPEPLTSRSRDCPALPSIEQATATLRRMRRDAISLLVRGREPFPAALESIPDPPPFLFARGRALDTPGFERVAVIGSRAASAAGRELAYGLGRDLALAGCTIVSGLARGIDGEAHRGALDAGGATVAVLGTGADVCYPPEHQDLFERILRQGGALTEFPPGTEGLRLHFPRRNRILSGFSSVVIVVEGGERSGARSTVDHALEQGREVMAVPRDPLYPGSVLPNRLIRDGARPVLGVRDVLEALEALPGRNAAAESRTVGEPQAGGGGADPEFRGAELHGTDPELRGGEFRGADPGFRGADPGLPSERGGAGIPTRRHGSRTAALEDLEHVLLKGLGRGRMSLAGCLNLAPGAGPGAAQAALVRLEVMGRVVRRPGGFWEKAR